MAHTSQLQLSRAQTHPEARAERKIRDINPNHGSPRVLPPRREQGKLFNRTTCDPRPNIALTGSVPTTSLDGRYRTALLYRNLPNPWSDNDVACARGQHPICVVH